VWITHDADLPVAQVDILRAFAVKNPYVLASPRDGIPSPVVAGAWGIQLQLPAAGDARLPAFLTTHVNGPQTPEPEAPCAGGVGDRSSRQARHPGLDEWGSIAGPRGQAEPGDQGLTHKP